MPIIALAFGSIVKGAIGAGVPIIAIPVLTMTHDVQFAVAVLLPFALGGAAGVAVGTYGLTRVPQDALSLTSAVAVLTYVAIRLLNPSLTLQYPLGRRLALPIGMIAGVLQGPTGMSAPISVTFLNALRLDRPVFIGTIAVFFTALTIMQIPALAVTGILTPERASVSLVALATVLGFMPIGALLAKHLSCRFFDFVTLGLLVVLAGKIIVDVLVL